jgi:cation transport regulator ChaC
MPLYFAYGSNLDHKQMEKRCPDSAFKHRAVLRDYRLDFSRTSTNRGCGVADIVESPGDITWGVVYEVPKDNLPKLNKCEGYKSERPMHMNSYNPQDITIYIDNDDTRRTEAIAYVAVIKPGPHIPNQCYLNHIIVGAYHWKLPIGYIEKLEAIETSD